ncbi:MAG TPA: sulfurtransferase [Anaerolineaceae bacterium]|nr:sulfurtransferase [Anaerolineaceae bacterium]HQH84774.1 sulfurtransferase [Anaerolineaceae bacterium]
MFTTFITADELTKHLGQPDWVLVDCRTDLMKPEWGREDYRRAHVPGSVYADLNRDLSGPTGPQTGRHPLSEPGAFRAAMAKLGIDASKQVVVIDTAAGAFAARLWWMLRLYGHAAVAVLAGGFLLWEREGRTTRSGDETNPITQFSGEPQTGWFLTAEDVNRVCEDPSWLVVDARTPERYRGEQEPIDPVAGRIPGAVNRAHTLNLQAGGLPLSPETLREQFTALLGSIPPERTVFYCGSGVTSAFHLLAMAYAGMPDARLYPGSWSEWIRDPNRPIGKG